MTPTERKRMAVGSRVWWQGSYGTVTGIDPRLVTVDWDDGQITHEVPDGCGMAYLSLLPEAAP